MYKKTFSQYEVKDLLEFKGDNSTIAFVIHLSLMGM